MALQGAKCTPAPRPLDSQASRWAPVLIPFGMALPETHVAMRDGGAPAAACRRTHQAAPPAAPGPPPGAAPPAARRMPAGVLPGPVQNQSISDSALRQQRTRLARIGETRGRLLSRSCGIYPTSRGVGTMCLPPRLGIAAGLTSSRGWGVPGATSAAPSGALCCCAATDSVAAASGSVPEAQGASSDVASTAPSGSGVVAKLPLPALALESKGAAVLPRAAAPSALVARRQAACSFAVTAVPSSIAANDSPSPACRSLRQIYYSVDIS